MELFKSNFYYKLINFFILFLYWELKKNIDFYVLMFFYVEKKKCLYI